MVMSKMENPRLNQESAMKYPRQQPATFVVSKYGIDINMSRFNYTSFTGDIAAEHLHYGGIACYSCRAFFR